MSSTDRERPRTRTPDEPAAPAARLLHVEVESVRWSSPDSGFAVLGAISDDGEEVILTGTLDHLHVGELLEVHGAWSQHARHGWRFEVAHVASTGIGSAAALIDLLTAVRHVGPSGAAWLFDRYGENVLEEIDADPRSRLREVPGIGPARIGATVRSWERLRGKRALRLFLGEHGVPAGAAGRIERALGPEAVEMLKEDPYAAIDVEGVGFATADALARALGVPAHAPQRLDAGLLHVLSLAELDGHCLLPRAELLRRSQELLGPGAAERLEGLIASGRVVADGDLIAHPVVDAVERRLARRVRDLAGDGPHLRLDRLERPVSGEFVPSDAQWAVVDAVFQSRLTILTGGPGTGKTATLRTLVELLHGRRRSVRLCAPTGKAARRLSEATGIAATTIHRLLGWLPEEGGFEHGPDDPLPGTDLLVVDEASMLSLGLADALLGAVGPRTHVLLVGDVDQLPPVGPGRVLEDLIASKLVPTVRLEEIFRQAARSLIVRAAHSVNHGERPSGNAGDQDIRDFFLIGREDPRALFDEVVSLADGRLASHYGLDAGTDVLVLSPMRRGPLGVDALNDALRARRNADGTPVPGTALRVGDRVIQTRNDHERELMNGELGSIAHLDSVRDQVIFAGDDGRRIALELDELATIRPAYAITVHKSQGSQAPAVVIPVFLGHRHMLTRNLLYTAITRAERVCVVVAQAGALDAAVARRDAVRRCTRLERLVRDG
ncbi:unannotated protein [freshwater metagenome]|uniref:Unannotated protein n=1 Tax=freshwater metagenome TaxID=449393 RepID=A0A6J7DK61_9ZZZZ|nr:ATP-dependent RecD-like DNA helicase [Actinomycetota bacterium]